MKRFLIRLGSRAYIVGEIASAILLAKGCEGAETTTSSSGSGGEATTSSTGAGGTGGDAGSGGSGAAGGSETTASSGGSGGVCGSGGAGGAATTTGSGGTGGCEPVACEAKGCGEVDNCGEQLDCGTCTEQLGDPNNPGPMTCGAAHTCECPAEGNSAAAMALCAGAQVPAIADFCAATGCDASLCGSPPVPKVPAGCGYAGALADETQVWCCKKP